MMFFQSQAIAIMTEDGAQELYRRLSGNKSTTESGEDVPLWKKLVGYLWVMTCLTITSPWFVYPINYQPEHKKWIFPYSFTSKFGLPVVGSVVAIGAIVNLVLLKAEI
jgi:hypothetical protein